MKILNSKSSFLPVLNLKLCGKLLNLLHASEMGGFVIGSSIVVRLY